MKLKYNYQTLHDSRVQFDVRKDEENKNFGKRNFYIHFLLENIFKMP